MTEELIAVIVGVIVSWALETIPKLKDFWSDWEYKTISLWALFEIVPLAGWALTCFAGFSFYANPLCTVQGGVNAFILGFAAFMGSQTNYAVAARHTENAQARNGH